MVEAHANGCYSFCGDGGGVNIYEVAQRQYIADLILAAFLESSILVAPPIDSQQEVCTVRYLIYLHAG